VVGITNSRRSTAKPLRAGSLAGQEPRRQTPRLVTPTWLRGRHPSLARLERRIPGVVSVGGDGSEVDLDLLAGAINGIDEHHRTSEERQERHAAPDVDFDYDECLDDGPQPTRATAGFPPMSRTEKSWLRLLATYEHIPCHQPTHASFAASGPGLLAMPADC
jgi:hypothetical protein